tara:strand:+ start:113 stop:406 length:294 start_codon:yes stop_codon:yes gene_type:complete
MMLNKNIVEEINSKVSEILENSPVKDVEKNVRVLLAAAFSRLDLVPREEFDVQQALLQRTREKLIALETKVATLEDQMGLVTPESNNTEQPTQIKEE